MDFERRFTTAELRSTEEGKLVGYAAVFNSLSTDLGGFKELLEPTVFDRSLREHPDVIALYGHDKLSVLGRVANGTLRVTPDGHGLRVEITPNLNTTLGRDVVEMVRRGDMAGMSFGFRPYPDGVRMDVTTSPATVTLKSVRLLEVSVCVVPAYPATEISVRALEEARAANVRPALERMRMRLQLAEKQ
jgi:HK97 family phage prohead protease